MGSCSQSSPSQHTEAKTEQHQSRVFLAVQWLQNINDDNFLSGFQCLNNTLYYTK